MASSNPHTYPPDLSPAQSEHLLSEIKDWSIFNGLAVRPPSSFVSEEVDSTRCLAVTAPVTLFPSPFPRRCFEEARAIQEAYNLLYAAIAADEVWLSVLIERLAIVDDFIKGLWEIHLTVRKEGVTQPISLGIFRSDYMIHRDPTGSHTESALKQIEFNTIASSFGGLASKVSALHRHLRDAYAYPALTPTNSNTAQDLLPVNEAAKHIARGLALSHEAYGGPKTKDQLPLCVLFVVQVPENNIFDQLAISQFLWSEYKIRSFRLPFLEAERYSSIEPGNESKPLVYTPPWASHGSHDQFEVTTLYFRAGYAPSEYTSPDAWRARLHLERTGAVKCPSILTHLAGSKKIQQVLATPSSPFLDLFLKDTPYSQYIERIRATFAAIYPLDKSVDGLKAIELATNPATAVKYVLKPQREGGGNNIYGQKIPGFLQSLGQDTSKYEGHILMELVETPTLRNSIFRNGEVRSGDVIGELGIYGVCLWQNDAARGKVARVLENFEAGHLLRTKGRESEEGGVAAGFGSIDSVLLTDD